MKKHLFAVGLIVVIGFLIYANSLNNHFQFDDQRMLEGIKTTPSPKVLLSLYPTSRMLTSLSFFFNYHYRLSRRTTFEFHLVNIFAHILTAILIYWIVFLITTDYPPQGVGGPASRVAGTDERPDYADKGADSAEEAHPSPITHHPSPIPPTFAKASAGRHSPSPVPLFTALLFVTHPLCTEPVNYIIARSVLLATMFSFLSLLFFILYLSPSPFTLSHLGRGEGEGALPPREEEKGEGTSPLVAESEPRLWREGEGPMTPKRTGIGLLRRKRMRGKKFYLLGTFFSFLLAGYSKEIGFYYSLVMIFLYYWIFCLPNESPNKKKKVYLVFTISLFLFGLFVLRYTAVKGRLTFYGLGRIWEYFLAENKVFLDYLRLLTFPFFGLNVDHHHFWPKSVFDLSFLPYLLVNLSLLGIIFFLFRKKRLIFFSVLWSYILLLPYFFIPTVEVMVEYRTYPAIFGYVFLLSLFLDRIITKEKLRRTVFLGLIITFSLATFLRNRVWQDPLTIWEDAVKKSPDKARTHCNLGIAYHLFGNYPKAIEELSQAIVLDPGAIVPRSELGSVYRAKGDRLKAIEEYKKAVELEDLQGVKGKVYFNLGSTYEEERKITEAIEAYNNALKINPGYFEVYHNLGLLYYREKDYRQAMKNLEKAVEIQPMNTDTLNSLGIVYDLAGEYNLAINAYKRALVLEPQFAGAYYNLGISYENKHLLDEAIQAYKETLKINPHYLKALNNLGNIYYKKGNFEEAIKQYEKALTFAPNFKEAKNNLQEAKKKMNTVR